MRPRRPLRPSGPCACGESGLLLPRSVCSLMAGNIRICFSRVPLNRQVMIREALRAAAGHVAAGREHPGVVGLDPGRETGPADLPLDLGLYWVPIRWLRMAVCDGRRPRAC